MACLTVYQGMSDLPEAALKLFHTAKEPHELFLSLPWFRLLESQVLGKLRVYALTSDDGLRVHALLPMREGGMSNSIFAPRSLGTAANYYTPVIRPLIAADTNVGNVTRELAAAIAAERPAWDTLDVSPLNRDDPHYSALAQALRAAGMAVQPYFCFGNWYLRVDGRTFDEYASSLPSRLRNTLRRKAQQLPANRLRMEIVTGEIGLETAIDAYQSVYKASWKQQEPYVRFMPEFIRCAATEGWLRLGVAWVDGRPAAAQVWTVAGGVASIYKLAYDERYQKLSVGSLLSAHLMRHVIDVDRVREVDFLSGDDSYKQDWMSHRREKWGLTAFNLRTAKGLALSARHIGGRALKRLVRRPSSDLSSTTAVISRSSLQQDTRA